MATLMMTVACGVRAGLLPSALWISDSNLVSG